MLSRIYPNGDKPAIKLQTKSPLPARSASVSQRGMNLFPLWMVPAAVCGLFFFVWPFCQPGQCKLTSIKDIRAWGRPEPVAKVSVPGNSLSPAEESGASLSANGSAVLECFQVHPPVWTALGWDTKATNEVRKSSSEQVIIPDVSCSVFLMNYSFGFSYGHPFVGSYHPPSCSFNSVTINLTVTSRGRQFDRLAMMFLNDTEVFRTSTAEPTIDGIIWTYTKDMTLFLSLWQQPQKIIFDLGNLIDDTYTGFFNATLTATFFTKSTNLSTPSLILPISASRSEANQSSHFVLPDNKALATAVLPRHGYRAVASILSTGQAAEEFWWGNVPSMYTSTFSNVVGDLYGFSPFRTTHLYIDGQLVGLAAPFPVIFTGGVVPALWRPIVGPDAFDLRPSYIDITPFLGILSDGNPHTFEIRIAGLSSESIIETVGQNWVVSGAILLWLDEDSNSITTGTPPEIQAPIPIMAQQQLLGTDRKNENITLRYETFFRRTQSTSATINSQYGSQLVTTTQTLTFSHESTFSDYGRRQVVSLHSAGEDRTTYAISVERNIISTFDDKYNVDTRMEFDPTDPKTNLSIEASIALAATDAVDGENNLWNPGREGFGSVNTSLNGTGYYFSSPSTRTGASFGGTSVGMVALGNGGFESANGDADGRRYERWVEAVNGTVQSDSENWMPDGNWGFDGELVASARKDEKELKSLKVERNGERRSQNEPEMTQEFSHLSARELLGRGPGRCMEWTD